MTCETCWFFMQRRVGDTLLLQHSEERVVGADGESHHSPARTEVTQASRELLDVLALVHDYRGTKLEKLEKFIAAHQGHAICTVAEAYLREVTDGQCRDAVLADLQGIKSKKVA